MQPQVREKKKQNGGWKVSDADWFFFLFIIRVDFFMIRVDPTLTGGPSWSGPTFVPAS